MNETEQNIRNYLKDLTIIEIANCCYFDGVDFDTIPMKTIIRKIDSLFEEVKSLSDTVDNNFKSNDGYPAPDPLSRIAIIDDLKKKRDGLLKLLDNKDIREMFMNYKKEEEKRSSRSH